jgi:hypothetical protein
MASHIPKALIGGPACAVGDNHRMGADCDVSHAGIRGFSADKGLHKGHCRTGRRAGRAIEIRPVIAGIARRKGSGTVHGPDCG